MRLLLADDHDLVRDAIGRLIQVAAPEADLTFARDCATAQAALAAGPGFDLALIDWCMPGMDGTIGLRRLLAAADGGAIAIFSGAAARREIDAALKLGVRGFVPKTLSGDALIAALRLMIAGERYIPAAWHDAPETPDDRLEAAERRVLGELFKGRSNKEIALALDMPESSVKMHLRGLSRKLGARNRTEAIILAMREGLGPDFGAAARRARDD
ncbi:MAG: response regulator transcription factor [Pseudomonadota bacterium]